jgi:hypothetical protein
MAQPVLLDKKTEKLYFLSFFKGISININPVNHLPVKANGILPMVGKVDLKLQEVMSK